MKKGLKYLAAVLAGVSLTTAAACESSGTFLLSYADGMNLEEGYDTDLLYKNNTQLWGGDSGVIWVSKEQSEEYGGYFYQYMSECGGIGNYCPSTEDGQTPPVRNNNVGEAAYYTHMTITRSRDLNDWELCSDAIDNGMALQVMLDEWVYYATWAPEVFYHEESGKYFMYFAAQSWVNNEDRREMGAIYSDSSKTFDRFYLGIAASDTPVGPFRLIRSVATDPDGNFDPETYEFIRDENGEIKHAINPTIMMDVECDNLFYTDEFKNRADFKELDEIFAAIDVHPFMDDDGEFYMYFAKHVSSGNNEGNTIWGVKMKDMITPDYSTISMCIANSYWNTLILNANGTKNKSFVRVEYKGETENDPNYPRHLASSYERYTAYENGQDQSENNVSDGGVCEAPQMLTTTDDQGRKVYLLTYSPRGVGPTNYDVKFAWSYSPLEGFLKPEESQGATILGVDGTNRFMSSLGHVQFLHVDGQDYIAHWEWPAAFEGIDQGRIYAVDAMTWQYEPSLGFKIPVSNGPTASLQPLPSIASGYRNVADRAEVSATNDTGDTKKYLTDGMAVTRNTNENKEFSAKKNKTKITLTFSEPVSVRGILIYNSYTYVNTFKSVSKITFSLAEKPLWHSGNETSCVINNLLYNVAAYTTGDNMLQAGSAAVATFNEIKVTKIVIEFNENDKLGNGDTLRISEIVVLGK